MNKKEIDEIKILIKEKMNNTIILLEIMEKFLNNIDLNKEEERIIMNLNQ